MSADDVSASPPQPDDFDRALRELTSGTHPAARHHEPSAAERARLAAAVSRRERAARRRRRLSATAVSGGVIVAVAAALAAVGVGIYFLRQNSAGPRAASGGQTPGPNPLVSGVGSPVGPSVPGSPAFTTADPFAGTPAEHWADGAAGVTAPPSRPVTGFSAAQVAAAYAATKRLLIAANLNQQTLDGGKPTEFARLLAPQLRSYFLHHLNRRGVSKRGYGRSTRLWVTSFAPGSTEFVGNVIKVHGHMSATTALDSGRHVLRVRFRYLFVYPVQRPGQPATRMRIVAEAFGNADFAQWNDPGGPLQVWWLPGNGGAAGSRCDINDGFVHPDFPGSSPDRVKPSGTPRDPYNLNAPQSRASCQAVTRT